jgi:hypothetical protein
MTLCLGRCRQPPPARVCAVPGSPSPPPHGATIVGPPYLLLDATGHKKRRAPPSSIFLSPRLVPLAEHPLHGAMCPRCHDPPRCCQPLGSSDSMKNCRHPPSMVSNVLPIDFLQANRASLSLSLASCCKAAGTHRWPPEEPTNDGTPSPTVAFASPLSTRRSSEPSPPWTCPTPPRCHPGGCSEEGMAIEPSSRL